MNGTAGQPLPWQTEAWQRLLSAFRSERLGHATLIVGPRGVGKRSLARLLCTTILCSDCAVWGGCGMCPSCRQVADGTHPDWLELRPEAPGKPITVDAVRAFSSKLFMTSHYRRGRIALIDPAEAMNLNAANSLLKTLEEPPADSYVVLVSDRLLSLPPTIRSRCRIVNAGRPTKEGVEQWLLAQGLSPERACEEEFVRAPLRAQALSADGYAQRKSAWSQSLREVLLGRQDVVSQAQAWSKEDVAELFAWLYGWTLDLWRLRALGGSAKLANEQARAEAERQAGAYAPADLARLSDRIIAALGLLDSQTNAQSLLETVLVAWLSLENSSSR